MILAQIATNYSSVLTDKLQTMGPEFALAIGAFVCLGVGLARPAGARRLAGPLAIVTLLIAFALTFCQTSSKAMGPLPDLPLLAKQIILGFGVLLLLVASHVPDQMRGNRESAAAGASFDAANVMRGEFFCFLLLSLLGAILCAGSTDLVWLFLALELTSLPTYVLVATARERIDAQEAGVKYFFLGALAAAIFLYGFTLIYGATGFTSFSDITAYVGDLRANQQSLPPLLLTGIALSVIGISFKIAAVPMHFYAADVYQGANVAVTTFLAFVPKAAGFISLMLILALVGWPLPGPIAAIIAVMAVFTMTIGNTLGLLQDNVKRVLAYSSIAHSGYMLLGLLAGPLAIPGANGTVMGEGLGAVLFYLLGYGLATLGAFAVVGSLNRANEDEAQDYAALSGLAVRRPVLAGILLLSVLSLIGLPPMVGFLGKVYLFSAAYQAGYLYLVIIAVLNSAISAVYYLRIASACFFGQPDPSVRVSPVFNRTLAAAVAVIAALILGVAGNFLAQTTSQATHSKVAQAQPAEPTPVVATGADAAQP